MLDDPIHGFRMGPWEIRPRSGEIHGPQGTAHVEPKVMEVFVMLARTPGEVVDRDALLREVWGARAAVADEPLTRCIAELRRVLADSRQTPTFIQTIPKRGYRLISEIAPLGASRASTAAAAAPAAAAPSPGASPVPVPASSGGDTLASAGPQQLARRSGITRSAVGIGALTVAAAAGLGAWLLLGSAQREAGGAAVEQAPRNTIAVLPFVNVGGTADAEYFGDGLAEEILNRLNAVDGLRVVARTSSFSFKSSSEDVGSIAARLRTAHLLEGSVRRNGDRIRISARLVDAERGFELWSESYEGVLGDLFALQDEIANAIVMNLHANVPTLGAAAISTRAPTDDVAAYELLLRGRQYLNRRDESSLRRSVVLFEQAIALDAGYGQAYVELAKAYALLPAYSSELQQESFDRAMATVAAGLEHDPSVDDAMQGLLGLISYARWEWIPAEVAFRRALERSPNDPDLLQWYSQFLSAVGRTEEALQQAQRAKDIDLLSPVVNHRLYVSSMWAGDDDAARHYAQVAEELGMAATANPDSYIVLKLRSRDYAAVRPLLIGVQTMFARPTAWVDPLLDALASPAERPRAVRAVASAEESRDIARKYLFGAWLYLGETDRALATALELVHDRPSFDVEFLFAQEAQALRAHPRFGELVRAIGLNRYWDQFGWPQACSENDEQIVCH